MSHSQKQNQSTETSKITEIIELTGNNFKTVIIQTLKALKKNTNIMERNERHGLGVAILISDKIGIKIEY